MAEPPARLPVDASQSRLDLEAVAQRLLAERAAVGVRLASMTRELESVIAASVDSNADDEHDPEGQTIAYERSQLAALILAAQEHLSAIEQATVRLEAGSYGTCEVCLQPIPAERLDARPTARTCVKHAAQGKG